MRNRTIINAVLLVAILAMPFIVSADSNAANEQVFNPTILNGPLLVCTGVPGGAVGATCTNLCDLVAQIANIVYFMIGVIIWIVTPILILVGGIMYILAGANPGLLETAKKTLTGAVWGLVIVLCAYLLVYTFVTFLKINGVGGFGAMTCPLQ